MKTLEEIFKGNTGRIVQRHDHVLKIYDEFFSRYRNTEVRVLEIGITSGGSLLMWKEYFGVKAKIFGLDIRTTAKDSGIEDDQIKIFECDQGDRTLLKTILPQIVEVDIVIDDGSHRSDDQVVSFEELFPVLKENGIYAIEDLHCSYRELYGGGYKKPGTIIEYMKEIPDFFHQLEIHKDDLPEYPCTMSLVHGLHYFRNVLIVEKNSKSKNVCSPLMTGEGTIKDPNHDITGGRFDVE